MLLHHAPRRHDIIQVRFEALNHVDVCLDVDARRELPDQRQLAFVFGTAEDLTLVQEGLEGIQKGGVGLGGVYY